MKSFLVIQRIDNSFYAYREDEDHFCNVELFRKKDSTRLKQHILDDECDLSALPENSYIVFEIKED
jgi:hypothetical protein